MFEPFCREGRRGFTLIELLVAIAIISILIALILPAVQQAGGAARRMQCSSHLKQLILAMQNYHEAHGLFPLNYGRGPFDEFNTGTSWMQQLLPFVDLQALYNRIRFGGSLLDLQNREVARVVIPVYRCPSDTGIGLMEFRSNVPGLWAVNNYKACAGSNWAWGRFSPVTSSSGRNASNPDGLDHCNGLICRNGSGRVISTRLRDVRDGTSNTFAVGEAVPEWSQHTWWWFNATTATCAIPLNFKKQPDRQVALEGDWWHNYSFLSRHPGGGNFGLVDGSVRFLSDSIDQTIYRGLGTIQGDEVIGEF